MLPQELTRTGSIAPVSSQPLPIPTTVVSVSAERPVSRARSPLLTVDLRLPGGSLCAFVFDTLPKFSCFFHITIPVVWSFVTGHLPSFIISDVCDVKPLVKAHLFKYLLFSTE